MLGRCRRGGAELVALSLLGACAAPTEGEPPRGAAHAGESSAGASSSAAPGAGGDGNAAETAPVLSDDGFLTIAGDEYRIVIHPDRRAVALEVPRLEFDELTFARFDDVVPPVTARVYRHFQDAFDFLLVVNNRAEKPVPSPVAGESSVIANEIGGIGIPPDLNLTELRGLPPLRELELVLYLPNYLALTNGPSLHELMHRWGNYVVDVPEAPGHWGFSNVGGQLGGFTHGTLEDLGDGTFRATNASGGRFWPNSNGGNVIPYAPLELYLMGLLPPEAVPPLTFAVNPRWVDDARSVFQSDGFVTHTAEELAQSWGERAPDPSLSPKRFRTLIVLVTAPDEPVDWEDWTARVDDFVAERESVYRDELGGGLLYNFWSATGGLASLDAGAVDTALR